MQKTPQKRCHNLSGNVKNTKKQRVAFTLSLSLSRFCPKYFAFCLFYNFSSIVHIIAYFPSQGQNRQGGLSNIMNVFMRTGKTSPLAKNKIQKPARIPPQTPPPRGQNPKTN